MGILSKPESHTLGSISVALFAIHLFSIGSISKDNGNSLWNQELLHVPVYKWFTSVEAALLILNVMQFVVGKGKRI